MIDAVATASGNPTLKSHQLADKPRVVEQIDPRAIQQGQKVAIEIALRRGRGLIGDAEFAELLARPLAGVAVADDLRDAVGLQ